MEITYRPIEADDYPKVRQLLIEAGWPKRVQDTDRFERILRGASRTIVAIEGERVVGFARALFDGASNGYISTVAVASDKQRQGIGRGLVERLMDVEEPEKITWVLKAGRGSEGFWEQMGFKRSETAMEVVRRE
jgi:N-acetylglutamate synthase-like GNAT family acetyltransferase